MTYTDAKTALEEMARDHGGDGWTVTERRRESFVAAVLSAPVQRAAAFVEVPHLLALALEVGGTLRVRPEGRDQVACSVSVVTGEATTQGGEPR